MPCIEHTQRGNSGGYGTVKRSGKTQYAHRVAYADHVGVPVESLVGVVMHSCDNPRCVNPAHLVLGTHKLNSEDMVRKGRSAKQCGELSGSAILTSEQVDIIRARHIPRCRTNGARALSREFAVADATIRDALKQRTWKEN